MGGERILSEVIEREKEGRKEIRKKGGGREGEEENGGGGEYFGKLEREKEERWREIEGGGKARGGC